MRNLQLRVHPKRDAELKTTSGKFQDQYLRQFFLQPQVGPRLRSVLAEAHQYCRLPLRWQAKLRRWTAPALSFFPAARALLSLRGLRRIPSPRVIDVRPLAVLR